EGDGDVVRVGDRDGLSAVTLLVKSAVILAALSAVTVKSPPAVVATFPPVTVAAASPITRLVASSPPAASDLPPPNWIPDVFAWTSVVDSMTAFSSARTVTPPAPAVRFAAVAVAVAPPRMSFRDTAPATAVDF